MKRKVGCACFFMLLITMMLFSQNTFAASKKVKSIQLSTKNITMTVGQSKTLKATVKPSGVDKKVVWKSSNKKVVTVSSKGKLKAKKAGTAIITCSSKQYPKIKATCKVTVKKPVVKTESITLKDKDGLISENETAYLTVGYSYQLSAVISPSNATYKEVKWSSSDESIVTISNDGLCTAVSPGTVTITCASVKYPKVSASLTLKALKENSNPTDEEDPSNSENNRKDAELLEQVKTILSRTGEPLYRKLKGNEPKQKIDSFTNKLLWQVVYSKNGTIYHISAYEKDSWDCISETYCMYNLPTATTKYLQSDTAGIRDSLRDGSYNFKNDPKYVIIGWSMWGTDTTKTELEKRLNEEISDTVFNQLIEYSSSGAATRSGGSVSIVYGKNADGELCGKYAGVISYNSVSNGTTYDFIGTDSRNTEIYGKRFSGTAMY